MKCPKCEARFDGSPATCPECGVRILRSMSGVIKTSTVLISVGEEQSSYRSIHEVPEPFRRQLLESTNSENAGTIVIADRAGKEQLTQVVARREAVEKSVAEEASATPVERLRMLRFAGLPGTAWAGMGLLVLAILVIVLAFGIRLRG